MKNNQEQYGSFLQVNNQLFFCGIPFRLDSYSGCSHRCLYCFARTAELTNASFKKRDTSGLLQADTGQFKHQLVSALDTSKSYANIETDWLRHRVPIHWGGMSDPFQPCEERYRVSYEWLTYLSWYRYPTVISTKGTILQQPEYLQLLKEGQYIVQITLISDDEQFIHAIEPGAPTVQDRLNCLRTLAEAGIYTIVRIQPVIPNTIIENNLESYIPKLAKIGVKHIIAEGFKVQVRNPENTSRIWQLCPEAKDEYNYNEGSSDGFEYHIPSWRKWQYIKKLLKLCHENGMTFGAADNDMRDLGDTICCCGIDNIPGFENWWRYQVSQAAQIAKTKGCVILEDIQQYWSGTNNSIAEQAGALRDSAKLLSSGQLKNPNYMSHGNVLPGNVEKKTNYHVTAKYAVDYMWEHGGACSPECMFSITRTMLDGKLAYTYQNPIPLLEQKQIRQLKLF